MSDRRQHILHIIPIGGSTQRPQKDCISRAKVVDDASRYYSVDSERPNEHERKHNISTSEERIEWQTEWRRECRQLWGRQDADSRGCEG